MFRQRAEDCPQNIGAKLHLWRLPIIDDMPTWAGESKDACFIIPLFKIRHTETFDAYLIRAAVWAMRSWKLFTDAEEYDIPFYFYVEEESADDILPLLKENGITDKELLYFSGEQFNTEYIWLGKLLAMYDDRQFDKFKYIVISDIDLFIASLSRKKMPFFKNLIEHGKQGIGCSFIDTTTRPLKETHWINPYRRPTYEMSVEDACEMWGKNVTALTDKSTSEIYLHGSQPYANLSSFLQILHTESMKPFGEWFVKAGIDLQDDEACISVWDTALSTDDVKLWSINDHYVDKVEIIIGIQEPDILDFPHMYHAQHSREWKWRQAIGDFSLDV